MDMRRLKPECASDGDDNVSDNAPQLTLREWRTMFVSHFSRPTVLLSLAGVSIVLGLSGPFNTINSLSPLPRLVYWTGCVWLTYACGTGIYLLFPRLDHAPRFRDFAGASLLIGCAATCVLLVVNIGLLGEWPETVRDVLPLFGYALLISGLICGLSALQSRSENARLAPTADTPRLLDRLPLDKRGALVSLSVEDHYVQVTTTRGREMLLMRLRDAIGETDPVPGLQVHRSHWVALEHVTRVTKRGDGALITTSTGAEIPVSRSSMPELRAHKLLPKPSSA